jgi:hypothetical protein
VPAASERRQNEPDLVGLAVNDGLHVVGQARRDIGGTLEPNGLAALGSRCISPRHRPIVGKRAQNSLFRVV